LNNKALIGFLIILAGVLLIPVLLSTFKSLPAPAEQNNAATDSEWEPDPSAVETPADEYEESPPPPPFQFTAQTLINTAWQVQTGEGPVEVELLPGNQARATHPAVGTINGQWRVQGNGLTVTATYMGHTQTISCFIQGDQLIYEGYEIKRLR